MIRHSWAPPRRVAPAVALLAALCACGPPQRAGSGLPAWAPNTHYPVGARVSYNGIDYQALQTHTAQVGLEPPSAPGLWTLWPASAPTSSTTATTGIASTPLPTARATEEAALNIAAAPPSLEQVIPLPVAVSPAGGTFRLSASAGIYVEPATPEISAIGQYLADKLNPATGYGLQVLPTSGAPAQGNLYLTTVGGEPELGEEGYRLTITPELVTLVAYREAGLFRGLQTLRQLLPPAIEQATVQPGPWEIATGTIRDHPRFSWRGAMLDVARHFFSVEDVKRYIDLIAYYKMNRFHLHLSDDQGWRIQIKSWPNLATHGGSTAVGGGRGGYYSQEEYADIAAYAQRRYIILVPEIDMPGHTNAALASYAELNCSGTATALYTGIEVGRSSLCLASENQATFVFVDDVIREIAAITPGPYLHIGGDEALATEPADYKRFIERVQAIVQSYGKHMIGWEEIVQAKLLPSTIMQHWDSRVTQTAAPPGIKVIMSPASRAYLDMKYSPSTPLGLYWAGYIELDDAYTWDPATQLAGVSESQVLGVEAPLWTETIQTRAELDFMAFPRLPGYAEIGWSPAAGRTWEAYRMRLAAHGSRLTNMGVQFYRSGLVPWQ